MTKVTIRKLGREKAYGLAHTDKNEIEVDVHRHKSEKALMDTFIHEGLHICFPQLSETATKKSAKIIRDILWNQNYRKVNL